MSSFESAFDAHLEIARNQITSATFGHLAPKEGQVYPCWIVFGRCAYDRTVSIVDAEFGDLDDSPWLYQAICDYTQAHAKAGRLMRFTGTARLLKNGSVRLSGKTTVEHNPRRRRTA